MLLTMTDVDNTDDLSLLTNSPAQPEFLLHSLEQITRSIGLNVNTNKKKVKLASISTLSGKSLKLIDSSYTSAATSHLPRVMSTFA